MTGSFKKKSSPIYLRKNKPKQTAKCKNFLLRLYYHLVQVSEDFAVRLYICVPPRNIELRQQWRSSAQLSPTSSVKTPREPCSYCKLLIFWSRQTLSWRGRKPGLLSLDPSTSQFPQQWLESKRFWLLHHRSPTPDSSQPVSTRHVKGYR